MSLLCRFSIPLCSLCKIFRYAITFIITISQMVLSIIMSLFSRQLPQPYCLRIVLWYFESIEIKNTKAISSTCIFLLRTLAKPFCGFSEVFFYANTGKKGKPKITLGFSISLFSRFPIPPYSF